MLNLYIFNSNLGNYKTHLITVRKHCLEFFSVLQKLNIYFEALFEVIDLLTV